MSLLQGGVFVAQTLLEKLEMFPRILPGLAVGGIRPGAGEKLRRWFGVGLPGSGEDKRIQPQIVPREI